MPAAAPPRHGVHGPAPKPIEARFWPRVVKTENCWLWQAPPSTKKYAQVTYKGRYEGVHRVSYRLHFGEFDETLLVCHHCDTPLCVRPDHLFLGTYQENADDMVRKGRSTMGARNGSISKPECLKRGTENPNHKLTDWDVRVIRKLGRAGVSHREIGRAFGVAPSTVDRILLNLSWKLPEGAT